MSRASIESQVIDQFGEQWTKFPENTGYYQSSELLKDLFGPLLDVSEIGGKVVVDIGSGTGRIVSMLAGAGAKQVVAVEPSRAFEPLKSNTEYLGDRVVCLNERGDTWSYPGVELGVSMGVLHHIHDPNPTVRTVFNNLPSGGKFVVWLYGKEGNGLYLALAKPLRAVTTRIPHCVLNLLCWLLLVPLTCYIWLCRVLPLPMRAYMLDHIGRLDVQRRHLTIYDQLNPTWAKYYTKDEAESLLRDAGFVDVRSFHRHGYSWTVVGVRP
jgi:SAM-dependent methyltransferase